MSDSKLDEPSHNLISDCAYFHWLDDGSLAGHENSDWLAAEKELRQQQFIAQGIAWVHGTEFLPHGFEWTTIRV